MKTQIAWEPLEIQKCWYLEKSMEIWQRMPTSNKIEGLFLTSISNFQFSIEIDFLPFVMPISPSKHVWIWKMIPLLKDKNSLGSVMQETSVFPILSLLGGENQVWKSWTFGLWQSTGSGPNDMEPKMPGPFSMKSKPCSIRFEKKNHWCEQLQTILTTKV